jgi:protein-S-isoprenylcysteine O-methyltransferase Ste14
LLGWIILGGLCFNKMVSEILIKIFVIVLGVLYFIIRSKYITHYKKFSYRLLIKWFIILVLAFFYCFGYFDKFYVNLHYIFRILGLIIVLLGYWLFFYAHKHLSINWSPVLEKRFTKSRYLVKTGPYKYLVHPIYSASMLSLIGFFLLSSNLILTGIPLVILIIFYSYKIPREEKELRRNFGKSFELYFRERKRFIPGIW